MAEESRLEVEQSSGSTDDFSFSFSELLSTPDFSHALSIAAGLFQPGYNEFRPIVKETALSGQYLVQSNEVRDITNSLAFQHIFW